MHDQVGIAPDGRGEVRIARAGQRKVALVPLAVARLLQRTQHQVAQDALLRLARDLRGEPLIHLRRHGNRLGDLVRADHAPAPASDGIAPVGLHRHPLHGQAGKSERVAEAAGRLLEVEDALGVGRLVDAIDAGDCVRPDPPRHALVGAEHELLDQAVRPAALGAHDRLHVAVGIELDDRLGQIEVDGAAAVALGIQLEGELVHPIKMRNKFIKLRAHGPVRIGRGIR